MVIKYTHRAYSVAPVIVPNAREYISIDLKFTENKISFVTDTLTETGYSTVKPIDLSASTNNDVQRLSVVNVCRRNYLISF